VLCLDASTHCAVGDIRNTISDDGSIINERHIGDRRQNPAETVQVLCKEHAGYDAIVAFCVLDLQRILEHEASCRYCQCETHGDFQNGTDLGALLFPT
jgi:hypothetical protein